MASGDFKKLEKLLEDIKKLLILQLVKGNNIQSKDIAGVLGVDPAVISRILPRKK